MKARVLVLGGTGMLGSAVAKHFINNTKYDTVTTYRNKAITFDENALRFDVVTDSIETLPANFDYVINCIGIITPFVPHDPVAAIRINALFPWLTAKWCANNNMRFIHISTDCVYSGRKGKYEEQDLHDALDAYGKSKSLGECVSEAMVLRTSVIGEDTNKSVSLVEWAKSQAGKAVGGYSTHLWNGVTTAQYAAVCDKIISNDWYEEGLYHIFAQDDVSKHQMLHYFNEKFDLGLVIEEKQPESIDRTLRTTKALCAKLEIPTVRQMIMAM